MTDKREPPLRLEMGFGEALERFVRADPREIEAAKPTKGRRKHVGKEPKPFVFTLTSEEAAEINDSVGTGGHQDLHRRLTEELQRGLQVTFDDRELGELIRYMTRYGSGGFQSRLKRAFRRSLRGLLDL